MLNRINLSNPSFQGKAKVQGSIKELVEAAELIYGNKGDVNISSTRTRPYSEDTYCSEKHADLLDEFKSGEISLHEALNPEDEVNILKAEDAISVIKGECPDKYFDYVELNIKGKN